MRAAMALDRKLSRRHWLVLTGSDHGPEEPSEAPHEHLLERMIQLLVLRALGAAHRCCGIDGAVKPASALSTMLICCCCCCRCCTL